MKRTAFLICLLALLTATVQAQQSTDTAYVFRFVPGSDMFYVPFRGNGNELARLKDSITAHRTALTDSLMYLSITGYATRPGNDLTARRMTYLRISRVKSELILHSGATEQMFATDRHMPQAYGPDSLQDVIVVTLPASVKKVERLLGAAATVRIREQQRQAAFRLEQQQRAEQHRPDSLQARQREARTEVFRREEAACRETEEETRCCETEARTARSAAQAETEPLPLGLRFNLLRWATLTADLGVEYRPIPRIGILVSGSFANWGWQNKQHRYHLWEVTPEVRWYLGSQARGYLGALYKAGSYNYKLGTDGRKGDLWGVGLSGGYQLELNRNLGIDFHAAAGYTRAGYDKYTRIGEVNVSHNKNSRLTKGLWGVNHLGVTLVWKPFNR